MWVHTKQPWAVTKNPPRAKRPMASPPCNPGARARKATCNQPQRGGLGIAITARGTQLRADGPEAYISSHWTVACCPEWGLLRRGPWTAWASRMGSPVTDASTESHRAVTIPPGPQSFFYLFKNKIKIKCWDGGIGEVLCRRCTSGVFSLVTCHGTTFRPATTSLEGWDTSSRPPGALGLGHWPRVPRGSYSHLGLGRPPRSLILGGRALA